MNIFNWLFYAGYEKRVYDELKEHLTQINRTRLISFSFFFASACIIMTMFSFLVPSIAGMRYTYLSFLTIILMILGLAYFYGKNNGDLIFCLIYIFVIMVLAFGILIGTVLSPAEISATYIALLLTTPQLFIDKTYRMHIVTLFVDIAFIFMVIKFKDVSTWSTDIINSLIFYAVSTLLTTFNTNTRISRFLMEKKIRELAEIDQLTGLLNRNSYELALVQAEKEERESIYCVYLDVNGLHELNNKKGHEAGDQMLIYIAKAMQHTFGKNSTYRIGGDEFVAIGYNLSETEIVDHVENLRNQVDAVGYHVAIGYRHEKVPEAHIQHIVKEAESMMYVDKKAYYDVEGKNPQRIH